MDAEIIFWIAALVVAVIGLFVFIKRAESCGPVSERTRKRISGEWYK